MPIRTARIATLTLALLAAACSEGPPSDDTADLGASPAPVAGDSADTGAGATSQGTDTSPIARGRTGSPNPSGSAPAPADPDTARGLVAVGGSLPMTRVTLRDTVGRIVTITGAHATAISRLGGLEVWVAGTRSSEAELAASVFRVRAVEGVPAIDGRLSERRGGALVLTPADGRTLTLSGPPAALREYVGRRVWVTRSASGEVLSFGLIEEPD
jgi:hypothetical protein